MEAVLNLVALLLGLSAVFGYLNHRALRLPHTIGLMVIALAASFAVLAADWAMPALGLKGTVQGILAEIDLTDTLMKGILSFLLFAGALHVDLDALKERRWSISLMATVGVLISTMVIGSGAWLIFDALGLGVPYLACLVLGAIISPTDPVAVLGVFRSVNAPRGLQAKIAGESLFNDGVGIVVFTVLAAIAFGGGHGMEAPAASDIAILFLREAVGGALLGLLAGYIVFRAMRTIDEHNVEILLTLALVSVSYAIANALHVSGPIAVVVAGLLIGNHGTRYAMSERTRGHLLNFWTLIDEILNSLLFLVIGFEVLAVSGKPVFVAAALACIPLALGARLLAVSLPLAVLRPWREFTKGAVWVLTWGGLRGGISVALALALPASAHKDALLAVCYGVVVFSVIVQGLTVEPLIRRVAPPRGAAGPDD
ncbi:MAG: cation:proton antiporter [Alphaproteobacteria bacterium]